MGITAGDGLKPFHEVDDSVQFKVITPVCGVVDLTVRTQEGTAQNRVLCDDYIRADLEDFFSHDIVQDNIGAAVCAVAFQMICVKRVIFRNGAACGNQVRNRFCSEVSDGVEVFPEFSCVVFGEFPAVQIQTETLGNFHFFRRKVKSFGSGTSLMGFRVQNDSHERGRIFDKSSNILTFALHVKLNIFGTGSGISEFSFVVLCPVFNFVSGAGRSGVVQIVGGICSVAGGIVDSQRVKSAASHGHSILRMSRSVFVPAIDLKIFFRTQCVADFQRETDAVGGTILELAGEVQSIFSGHQFGGIKLAGNIDSVGRFCFHDCKIIDFSRSFCDFVH